MNDDKHAYSILFVEDEEILRKNYTLYLKMIFDSVYSAADGEAAYHIYKEKKPDILIVDINIPKTNGLDLLKKIRKEDQITKAIVLTAHKEKDFLFKAVSLKLTDYLVKPISKVSLQKSLNKVIDELRNFKTTPIKNKLFNDGYMWNYDTEEFSYNNTIIHLTNKEKILLSLFMNNLNSTLSTDKIIYSVWNDYGETQVNALKTMLKKLRKKLPDGMITNIHSIGYKINS